MGIPNASRQVYPGERITLEVNNTSGLAWNVYVRTEVESYSIRLGSYDPDTETYTANAAAGSALLPAAQAIDADEGQPVFSTAALELLRAAGETSRSVQVIYYNSDGAACQVITLDFGEFGETFVEDAIARDRKFLKHVEEARTEAAQTKGIATLKLPDGREEQYRSVVTLDALAATLRDRISRLEAIASGARFVGGYIH